MLPGDNLVVPVVRGLGGVVVLCRGSGSSTGCGIVAGSSVQRWSRIRHEFVSSCFVALFDVVLVVVILSKA